MRFLTRRIWRAFPELDRFDDARCARFVRAAHRTPLALLLTWFLASLAGALAGLVAIITPIALRRADDGNRYLPTLDNVLEHVLLESWWFWWGWLLAAMLAAFLTRDLLLRLRIRSLLRTRAICVQCHYSLLGLAVPPSLIVVCPECATPTHVDPALGELTITPDGSQRFDPRNLIPPPSIFTPARARVIKRLAIAVFVVLPVILGVSLGAYELQLRAQARRAASERITSAQLTALIDAAQPSPMPAETGAFFIIARDAEFERLAADTALDKQHPFEVVDNVQIRWPDIAPIYFPYDKGYQPSPSDLASARRGRWQFDIYQQSRLPAFLDALTTAHDTRREYAIPPSEPAMMILLPELGTYRHLARYNAARMKLARDARDSREWLRAFESTLALARGCTAQPFAIHALVAASVDAVAFAQLRDLLIQRPPDMITLDFLERVQAAIDRQQPTTTPQWLQGDRAQTLDTIAWVFETPDNIRFGRTSRTLDNFLSFTHNPVKPGERIGSYAENRAAVNAHFDRLTTLFALRPHDRIRQKFTYQGDLIIIARITGDNRRHLQLLSLAQGERIAITTMLALERHRLSQGDYPQRLADLVPNLLPAPPEDLWSSPPRELGYTRIDRTADRFGRAYFLYSVAGDAIDNQGLEKSNDSHLLSSPTHPDNPADFIWNRPSAWVIP